MACHMMCHMPSDSAHDGPSLLEVVSECHRQLLRLSNSSRSKAMKMLMLAFDDDSDATTTGPSSQFSSRPDENQRNGERRERRAQNWMKRFDTTDEQLERMFDLENDYTLVGHLPGSSKREQTINCYLLTGVKSLLQIGEAKFVDSNATDLCKREG